MQLQYKYIAIYDKLLSSSPSFAIYLFAYEPKTIPLFFFHEFSHIQLGRIAYSSAQNVSHHYL